MAIGFSPGALRSQAKTEFSRSSAISHSIKVLEKRLNVRLFHRTTRSVSLTEAGERLVAKLRPAMEAIGDALQELDTHDQTPTGTVRINASEGAIRLVLKPILAGFLARYPGIHLDIVSDGRLSDIVGDGFDAGIRLAEAVPKDMVAVSLMGPVRFAARVVGQGARTDESLPAQLRGRNLGVAFSPGKND